jgi:hypothetical protein
LSARREVCKVPPYNGKRDRSGEEQDPEGNPYGRGDGAELGVELDGVPEGNMYICLR